MKYIRTGSEIYDIDDLYVCEDLVGKPYATKNGAWCIYKESIIKEADTIEELCDEFVVLDDRPPKTKLIEKDFNKVFRWFNQCKISKQDIVVCGAIWTDKGLIYVAKMNDKGELELL